ncbi:MAG: hypothetical protein ACYC9L_04880 [Sulfuricaulis sp.]
MSSIALLPVVLISGENLLSTAAKGWLVLLALAVVLYLAGQGLIV